MSSQGPLSPTAVISSGTGQAWTNPTNVESSDDLYATCAFTGFAASQSLQASGFGFSIPAGATIDGIVLEIERHGSGADESRDNAFSVDLLNSSGTAVGDKGDTGTNYPTTDAYATYGSAADLWGQAWIPNDINSANFGGSLSSANLVPATTVFVDHMRITVYYTGVVIDDLMPQACL